MSTQTRRHYATTPLAMLRRAKAERVIKSHQLSDIILPTAPRNGDPQPWTRRELGMILGPALLEYDADQAAWNGSARTMSGIRMSGLPLVRERLVGREQNTRHSLDDALARPRGRDCRRRRKRFRGCCLIGYYTMVRPAFNLHIRWDEVTLNAKNLTGWHKLDQHTHVAA